MICHHLLMKFEDSYASDDLMLVAVYAVPEAGVTRNSSFAH